MLAGLIGCIVTSGLLFEKRKELARSTKKSGSENITWALNQLRVESCRLHAISEGSLHPDGRRLGFAAGLFTGRRRSLSEVELGTGAIDRRNDGKSGEVGSERLSGMRNLLVALQRLEQTNLLFQLVMLIAFVGVALRYVSA
jgi:hypothetical protein